MDYNYSKDKNNLGKQGIPKMRSTLFVVLIAVTIGTTPSCRTNSVNDNDAKSLTTKAALLLDSYSGNTQQLINAKSILDKAIRLNPDFPQAYVEMARYYIKSGHISYRDFKPNSLNNAEKSLNTAIKINPEHTNIYILFGHLYMLMDKQNDARKALEKADMLETDNPWLHMNWADLLEWEGKQDEKMARYRRLIEQGTGNTSALNKAYGGLIDYHNQKGEYKISRQFYQKSINLEPNNAWIRGGFGFDLLHIMGDVDASIAQYESALTIMNYGAGRLGFATALLGKWAELKNSQPKSARAEEYYEKAIQLYSNTDNIMVKCGEYIKTHFIVKALKKHKKVSIDSKDSKGDTALTIAAFIGKVSEIHSLVKMGANLELKDGNGYTPLMLAAYNGHLPAVKALVASGSDINKTIGKYTAGSIAAHNGHEDIANFLQQVQL